MYERIVYLCSCKTQKFLKHEPEEKQESHRNLRLDRYLQVSRLLHRSRIHFSRWPLPYVTNKMSMDIYFLVITHVSG